jgi:ribosomal protein L35
MASSFKDGNSEVLTLPPSTARKRRQQTMESASRIHSNPSDSPTKKKKTALRGLFNTVVNVCPTKQLIDMAKGSKTIQDKVLSNIGNNLVSNFENSRTNFTRSVMVLYEGGLLSKTKYNSIRSSEMYTSDNTGKKKRVRLSNGVNIPSLVPYKDLSKFIKEIDIGVLKELTRADTEEDLDGNDQNVLLRNPISGCYMDLEARLLQVASMYLSLNETTNILRWFSNPPGTFLVGISADGAPFGKQNEATAWLISFLNLGNRVASCEDNFLVLGANCKEDHPVMIKYAKQIKDEIALIESKTYHIPGHELEIKFVFELVPADMKWIATFSGELCNSATYNSSFANVTSRLTDLKNIHGSMGSEKNCTWKPWLYKNRLEVAKAVANYKHTITGKSEKRKRNLVTKYIATKNSRQEFEPILGPLISKAKAEPLHLGNNCWQAWNKEVMNIALTHTDYNNDVTTVTQLPFDCCFRRYLPVPLGTK